jgi:hypothetical protein
MLLVIYSPASFGTFHEAGMRIGFFAPVVLIEPGWGVPQY